MLIPPRIRSAQRRCGAVLLTLFALLLLGSGRPTSAQGGGGDNPPVILSGTVNPTSLPYDGGTVTITAEAIDDFGIYMAYAEVIQPDNTSFYVQLFPAGETGLTFFEGTVSIPPNYTDAPVSYGVNLHITDWNGGADVDFVAAFQVDAQPQFDEPPVVFNPAVEPQNLPSAGGTVRISAHATDNRGISEVYATLSPSVGAAVHLPLDAISGTEFEGFYQVPPNTLGTPVHYTVDVTALDDIGQGATARVGLVTVAPVAPPSDGRLKVSPGSLSFGRVPVGRTVVRRLVVRHVGRRGSGSISGVILLPEPAFLLVGAGSEGLPFQLRAGESRTFLVQFRPTARGPYEGSLILQRSDPGQPEVVVRLSGRGGR